MQKRRSPTVKKLSPALTTDAEAEAFVSEADVSDLDFSTVVLTCFKLAAKAVTVNMRPPTTLLEAVKAKAQNQRMPYQRYVRRTLEHAVDDGKG